MKRTFTGLLFISLLLQSNVKISCQTAWYHRWGLLPENTLDLFINEASGEKAFNTIFDLSESFRKRKPAEFSGTLFESEYIISRLKEYGLGEIAVERFGKTTVRVPVTGLLKEVSPGSDKIADIADVPFVLVSAVTGETEGDLVYIGEAYNGDLDKMDLEGKIVLTSASPRAILNMALQKGVKGIVSYYSPRPMEDPVMIPDQKGGSSRGTPPDIFIFNITPRDGNILRNRLLGGEKIVVHASAKFKTEETDIQVPTCIIRGTDPSAGEIIISAHLFEGYGVQGANDNLSGSAAILETARMISKMITDGKIPPPRRSIRFIWVPEYSGSIPWTNSKTDEIKMALCNINLDMVGLSLSRYQSYFVLHRTSYGNAHYVNDVMENYYRYVSENNQDNSVITSEKFFKPIVAPTGTNDPFYYLVESTSGGSDHDVFNDWGVGVPGILMITWPDPFYHTSEDRADKIDPTTLKRVAFISAASAYTIANAGENEAVAIADEVYGNAVRRLGYQISMAGDELNKANADTLNHILKYAVARVKGIAIGESMTLSSISELSPSNQFLTEITTSMKKSLTDMAISASETLTSQASHLASVFGMDPLNITPSREERRAAEIIPRPVESRKGKGYGYLRKKLDGLSQEVKSMYPVGGRVDYDEAAMCINGKNSVLDIKYLLDAQSDEVTTLADLQNLFRRMEAAGLIKL
jgi:aminopeptidase-like protein